MSEYDPTPDDRFTFGLWTVGNVGRDPFGDPVRPALDPVEAVAGLADVGAWGVNLHDNDLVPFGATPAERDRIVARFKRALDEHGLRVPMCTQNLFTHPIFKDGAFTASDERVRAFAVRKTMDAIDLGQEFGARVQVFWGGREGQEAGACRDPRDAIKWMREAIDFLCAYVADQGYDLRFALEPKPNEPRGDIYLPTVGHMLHFITTLDRPEMVGVNPEVAHDTIAGLRFSHAVAQAMEAEKLFHVDLNAQRIGRFDQDMRFGSEDLKDAFLLIRLLEGTATGGSDRYGGPRHFDAHAYRTEDRDGVWDFARGCMRTYKILAERARAFDADPEVKELLAGQAGETGSQPAAGAARGEPGSLLGRYSPEAATALRALDLDPAEIARRGLRHERLDQITIDYILGAPG